MMPPNTDHGQECCKLFSSFIYAFNNFFVSLSSTLPNNRLRPHPFHHFSLARCTDRRNRSTTKKFLARKRIKRMKDFFYVMLWSADWQNVSHLSLELTFLLELAKFLHRTYRHHALYESARVRELVDFLRWKGEQTVANVTLNEGVETWVGN